MFICGVIMRLLCQVDSKQLDYLKFLDHSTTVHIKPPPAIMTFPTNGTVTFQLLCITKGHNKNCSIDWDTGSISKSHPIEKPIANGQQEILTSSVNITVGRNHIGTNVTCTVSCNLTEDTISAIYTVDAKCRSFVRFVYLVQWFHLVMYRRMYKCKY